MATKTAAGVPTVTGKLAESLLLYFETCVVDQAGGVDSRRMNADDMALAKEWADAGFIQFGRIAAADIVAHATAGRTHWVHLTDAAFERATELRRARAVRNWDRRGFRAIGYLDEAGENPLEGDEGA